MRRSKPKFYLHT